MSSMIISAIVAKSKNNVIGNQNKLLWHLPSDLRRFREITMGHAVIMGRKTFESIGHHLEGRLNIVVTRQRMYVAPYCIVSHNIYDALGKASIKGVSECFIIGGGEIYEQTQKLLDRIYLTEVEAEFEGDTKFPILIKNRWSLVSSVWSNADDKNQYSTNFKILDKL